MGRGVGAVSAVHLSEEVPLSHKPCPVWVGYLLLNPLRRLVEDPYRMLGPLVTQGMKVLEPGCGMGFFTLPLARMVGSTGRVVAVDVQPRMLDVLRHRAARCRLLNRVELRLASQDGLGVADLAGTMDLVAAIHMVHEVKAKGRLLGEMWLALKPGGRLLLVEPKRHVSSGEFEETVGAAKAIGFALQSAELKMRGRAALLVKGAKGPD